MSYNLDIMGSRMKKLRKERKLSLAYVASYCGVEQYQTVSSWESGNTVPPLKTILKLCELYDCELGYLVGEYDCKWRTTADIKRETGLSEAAVEFLRTELFFRPNTIAALNAMIEFDNGGIIHDISDFLFYCFDGWVEAGNVKINGTNMADIFLLEIISELRALRKERLKEDDVDG